METYTHVISDEDSAYHGYECYIQRGAKVEDDLIVVKVNDPKKLFGNSSVFVKLSELKSIRAVKLGII